MFTNMSQGKSVVVARPDDSSDQSDVVVNMKRLVEAPHAARVDGCREGSPPQNFFYI